MEEGAHLVQALDVGQVNLLQEIGFRGSHGVRGTCDWLRRRRRSLRSREWRVRRKSRRLCRTRRVGTCFELGEAPAVLYTARRGAAGGTTGCGNASASALVSSAVTTIATRMARSAPCAGTRACPRRSGPPRRGRRSPFGPSLSLPSALLSQPSAPTPGSAPLPSAFPSEILPQFLYLGSYDHSTRAGGASGARHHPHAELRAHLSGAAQNPVHHTYRERGRRRTPRDASGASASSLESRPDPQEVPLDECVAFPGGCRARRAPGARVGHVRIQQGAYPPSSPT